MEKPIQQKQKSGIVTLLNDTILTKVTNGKYATRVPDEVAYGITTSGLVPSKTLSSIY